MTSLLREREGKLVGTLKRADVYPPEVGDDDPLLGPVRNEIMLREGFGTFLYFNRKISAMVTRAWLVL